MSLFSNIFSKKPKIYYIEINDVEINKELSKVILQIKKNILDFKESLGSTTLESKEAKLEHMQDLLLQVREKLSQVSVDVNKILKIELANKNYFSIKDQSFLSDKTEQIKIISEKISEFLNIIQQRPSSQDFKQELLEELLHKFNQMSVSLDKMIADDYNLKKIYKKINDL